MSKSFLLGRRLGRYLGVGALVCAAVAMAGKANATPITGASSAFGESVFLSAVPVIGTTAIITSGALPTASGTAPGSYSSTNTAVSAFVTGVFSTGALSAVAASNVDGSVGAKQTSASATVVGLTGGLLGAIGLTATTVMSSAAISGDFGSLSSLGSTQIQGLMLGGVAVNIGTTVNNVLLNVGGVMIVANEQIAGGTANAPMLTVNALDITFTNALELVNGVTSTVNGTILISHSQAQMAAAATPVPVSEPASVVLFGGALLGMAGLLRRHQRAV